MAYEALYRRYRPRRFAEVKGQEHVVAALANAVANDRVGHAYLFSGPRGTGKTSSARLLAKALNCTNRSGDGEPCDECEACTNFNSGSSYDLRELDAASNNGVEAMRDLISKVGLSAGGHGVFILDEVHMLSSGAENALLKTLEEPPPGVTFVLCTTEPNKVVPTIRSRTQHLEFNLLPADKLVEHVKFVAADAGLSITDADIDFVVRSGGGSARDTLSALDQVVAAGGAPEHFDKIGLIITALAARDTGAALVAVNEATRMGRDPEVIGREILTDLRNAFLATMGADLAHLDDNSRVVATERSEQFGAATLTRSMETLGTAIVEMRQAPDPRVDLELALVRLTRPELDTDPSALVARIENLERNGPSVVQGAPGSAPAKPAAHVAPQPSPQASHPPAPEPESGAPSQQVSEPAAPMQDAPAPEAPVQQAGGRPADVARAALANRAGSSRQPAPTPEAVPPNVDGAPAEAPTPPTVREKPTLGSVRRSQGVTTPPVAVADPQAPLVEQLVDGAAPPAEAMDASSAPPVAAATAAWNEHVLGSLPPAVKARFSAGHFLPPLDGATLRFALPNEVHRQRCEEVRADVDTALAAHFGHSVPLDLVVGELDDASAGDSESSTMPPAPAPNSAAVSPAQAPAPAAAQADAARAPSAPTERYDKASTADRPEEEIIDVNDLTDASEMKATGIERLEEAFPGAELVEDEP